MSKFVDFFCVLFRAWIPIVVSELQFDLCASLIYKDALVLIVLSLNLIAHNIIVLKLV